MYAAEDEWGAIAAYVDHTGVLKEFYLTDQGKAALGCVVCGDHPEDKCPPGRCLSAAAAATPTIAQGQRIVDNINRTVARILQGGDRPIDRALFLAGSIRSFQAEWSPAKQQVLDELDQILISLGDT